MNHDKRVLAWINCYGGWNPDLRDPAETRGYDQYLDGVVHHLNDLEGGIEAIYLSGGMLDSDGQTECETTGPELKKRLSKIGINLPIQYDEESVTSPSIARKFLQTWREEYTGCQPILFTDKVRFITNAYSLKYFSQKYQIELPPIEKILIPIERLDIHPHSTIEYQKQKLERMKKEGVEAIEREEIEKRRKQ